MAVKDSSSSRSGNVLPGQEAHRDKNPDPITSAPGSHPVATGVGAAAAGAAGAAIGSIVPGIGTVIGGVVGAVIGSVGGGYAGKAVGEAIDPTGTDEYWGENHKTQDYAGDANYEKFRPAYQYGATLADSGDTATFEEQRARADWAASPHSEKLGFDQAKNAIQSEFNRKIQLREEQLRVNKTKVAAGEVSVRKEVTTEQKTIEVPVEHEEIVITRRNVAGSEADGAPIKEEEIRVPVSEERVSVTKETVVTGEVEVAKRKTTGTQVVGDSVRKETLKVDKSGSAHVTDETKS